VAVESAAYTNVPALNAHTFEDLQSTGHLRLVRSEPVKRALFACHSFDQSSRQWAILNIAGELHYFELIAGVIHHQQATWAADRVGAASTAEEERRLQTAPVDPAGVQAAAERLRARPAAVSWLPMLYSMQLEQVHANRRRLELAAVLLRELQAHAAQV
jgi:hypothetical protein